MKSIRDNKGIVTPPTPHAIFTRRCPSPSPLPIFTKGRPSSDAVPSLVRALQASGREACLPQASIFVFLLASPITHSPSFKPVRPQETSQSMPLSKGWKMADSFLPPLGGYLMSYTPKLRYSGNGLKTSPQLKGGAHL